MVVLQLACCLLGLGGQIQESHQEWRLAPRLQPGLELVYRGKVDEQSLAPGVMFRRSYQLEVRLLVLEVRRGQAVCAFLTQLSNGTEEHASARLEIAEVDSLGRLLPPAHAVPGLPNSPATWEHGFMVEVSKPVLPDRARWMTAEPGLPLKQWEVAGLSPLGGTPCVWLRGVQETEDWRAPRADRAAWQVLDNVWISNRAGVAQKVQRTGLYRSPARQNPDYKITTTYELESLLQYDGSFFLQRRRDVEQVADIAAQLRALKDGTRKPTALEWKALLERIDQCIKLPAMTPYREAVWSLRSVAQAASENRLAGKSAQETGAGRLAVGQAAPEFVTQLLGSDQTVTLRHWRGKVVLMAFFLPQSDRARDVLLYLQDQQRTHSADRFQAVAMVMQEEKASLQRLKQQYGLTVPIYSGKSLRHSYEVRETPRFVLLDEQGKVLLVLVGLGPETMHRLTQKVREACLPTP
jgi:peroxiredoxin